MSGLIKKLAVFGRDSRGSLATVFGLGAPVLCIFAAGAYDLGDVMHAQSSLQRSADSSALAGAKQFSSDRSAATADRTKAYADGLALAVAPRWTTVTTVGMNAKAGSVTVTQTGHRASLFGTLLPPWTVTVTATARQAAQTPLCVLGARRSGSQVVNLQDTSLVTAQNCLVQSNSDMRVESGAALNAGAARAVGAATGPINPAPLTDAPFVQDPFADLNINVPLLCTDLNLALTGSGTQTLNPGVHCGLMVLGGNGKLILNPGEHYFLNGSVTMKGQAQLVGSDVVLIFKGLSGMSFSGKASMALEGRQSGPYSGFVMITDRSQLGSVDLSTDSARVLHGTIYLPSATLNVSGTASKVADQSPWTVIVANKLNVSQSADLVINSDYSTSPIPVPPGVGPNGALQLVN